MSQCQSEGMQVLWKVCDMAAGQIRAAWAGDQQWWRSHWGHHVTYVRGIHIADCQAHIGPCLH